MFAKDTNKMIICLNIEFWWLLFDIICVYMVNEHVNGYKRNVTFN